MQFLITRILWLRRSKWQFLLAGLAFFIGLCTLMTALNAFLRIRAVQVRQEKDGHFLMLNKKISMVNTLGMDPGLLSKEEISNIRNCGLFSETGEVFSNKFRAQIQSSGYIPFQSLVFFESVSDRFLDTRPQEFHWQEGRSELPIIVSQDFLNLYNFGFALGQGLPQMGREALQLLSFTIVIDGPGGREVFTGKVAGFSERIASVLVPTEFMHWANRKIALQPDVSPSRVMVKTSNPSNPSIAVFLKKFRLTTSQEKIQLGKSAMVLDMVMKGLSLLGLLFMLLALVMFSTNFRLVMAEAESDIRLLIELGYAHKTLAFQLLSWFLLLLLFVFGGSAFLCIRLDQYLSAAINSQGIPGDAVSSLGSSLFFGFIFTLAVGLWNGFLILNHLRKVA
jgi:hypothetical protein